MAEINWKKVKVVCPDEVPVNAVQVHLYSSSDMLRPRGSMEKESLGAHILERLLACHESWSDPKYGDNPDEGSVLEILHYNMKEEMNGAWREFLKRVNRNRPE